MREADWKRGQGTNIQFHLLPTHTHPPLAHEQPQPFSSPLQASTPATGPGDRGTLLSLGCVPCFLPQIQGGQQILDQSRANLLASLNLLEITKPRDAKCRRTWKGEEARQKGLSGEKRGQGTNIQFHLLPTHTHPPLAHEQPQPFSSPLQASTPATGPGDRGTLLSLGCVPCFLPQIQGGQQILDQSRANLLASLNLLEITKPRDAKCRRTWKGEEARQKGLSVSSGVPLS